MSDVKNGWSSPSIHPHPGQHPPPVLLPLLLFLMLFDAVFRNKSPLLSWIHFDSFVVSQIVVGISELDLHVFFLFVCFLRTVIRRTAAQEVKNLMY